MEKETINEHSCVDCGTQNCKYKDRTYPEFVLRQILKKATGNGLWKDTKKTTRQ